MAYLDAQAQQLQALTADHVLAEDVAAKEIKRQWKLVLAYARHKTLTVTYKC